MLGQLSCICFPRYFAAIKELQVNSQTPEPGEGASRSAAGTDPATDSGLTMLHP